MGLIGKVMGRIMAWHNQPDNEWTVSLLEIQPTDHVLEIGFGPGQAIRYASRRVPDGLVCGIDHSETMVQEASKYNAAAVAARRGGWHSNRVMWRHCLMITRHFTRPFPSTAFISGRNPWTA